ncbi:MAG: hypothetical protein H8D23_27880 [Candidatus Brocadiales bacterium]|nr:hypothetical protein [Candidatus Brocadiales bacterium]
MDTPKSNDVSEIMFVDLDTEVTDKAIALEFKLVRRLNPKLKAIFISTPSRTASWGEHNVSRNSGIRK